MELSASVGGQRSPGVAGCCTELQSPGVARCCYRPLSPRVARLNQALLCVSDENMCLCVTGKKTSVLLVLVSIFFQFVKKRIDFNHFYFEKKISLE